MSRVEFEVPESKVGKILSISGPVVVAEGLEGSRMYELVRVGVLKLVGEIIQLDRDRATIQVYEETGGLMVGEPVERTSFPLSVELGPGVMGSIFDGIQRPLDKIASVTDSVFIPRGIYVSPLNRDKEWEFTPADGITIDSLLTGGDIFGVVPENSLTDHSIMVPPNAAGTVKYIAEAGNYTIDDTVLELEYAGKTHKYTMAQIWPVRKPRPVAKSLSSDMPLFTGQRVLDALFPVPQGGTTAIPGAFGVGKTCISHAVSKHSNSDGVVYAAVGERGNEVCEILTEFPELKVEIDGREESVMKRTVCIANASNMPVAAREASMYTAVTIAEYYRDMGRNFSVIADSTSRWAEALREISGRLAEMPAEQGMPAHLGARLHSFYERAGKVQCLGGPHREGSITIIGAVSPPGGDFSDIVCVNTLSIVQTFWGLDKKLAQRKHFPAVNYGISYSKGFPSLMDYYEKHHPGFMEMRTAAQRLLQTETELMGIVQLVGRENLGERDKLVLETARLLREGFLQQNSFTPKFEGNCPFYKTVGMLKNILHFHELADDALIRKGVKDEEEEEEVGAMDTPGGTLRFAHIYTGCSPVIQRLARMKFEDPRDGQDVLEGRLEKLYEDITESVAAVVEGE
ncbi:V-type proton ATPase catalytic subunit A [Aduncisulcus paluster]|uniref:H(+)-transporting two-sector ATPase n=1 Tax=Aduncisulcus paluster TaxID=2918883 RepID=A0ABQ5K939_9EUKA|nr:V-type proton ATPase catalytic subunit A [Aduncisulcus paluster]